MTPDAVIATLFARFKGFDGTEAARTVTVLEYVVLNPKLFLD